MTLNRVPPAARHQYAKIHVYNIANLARRWNDSEVVTDCRADLIYEHLQYIEPRTTCHRQTSVRHELRGITGRLAVG